MSRYLARFKGLLPDDPDRSWRAWAAQKLHRKPCPATESVVLFPGWAARRYHQPGSDNEHASFDIDVSVSGYASSCRANGHVTRSQRAFLRIAKGFASLPRISDQPTAPDEEAFSADLNALEQQLRSTDTNADDSDTESPFLTAPPRQMNTPLDVLQKLHCNLESRMQLFWSSCLSARTVRLHLFASPRDSLASDAQHRHAEDDALRPIATKDVVTAVDGSFNARFSISWEDLCQHHRGVYIAFGLPAQEHDLVIVAELLPLPIINASVSTPNITLQSTPNSHLKSSQSNIYLDVPPASHTQSQSHPHLNTLLHSLSNSISSSFSSIHSTLMPSSTSLTHATLPLTHSPIRVISDIDDTVKMSGITEGARAVFHNVFVKELKDGIIPGMGEWYTNMWERGVRFHYVSNGPFEYLPLLKQFFELSKLPPGSIKLKSYAGRSLLSGLLSAPAARKRAGVVEILDSFPDSKFILIGDSGEQDLELYADLARERPEQITAVLIRDADESSYQPIRDPTGQDLVGFEKHDYTSLPASEAPSPRLEFSDFTRDSGDEGQQQMTPRAKMPKTFLGESENVCIRMDVRVFDEDSVDTPKQKSLPVFESPPNTPLGLSFLGPPNSMTTTPDIITTPPLPIHLPRLPASPSFSSSSPTLIPSSLRPDSLDRPRAVKTTSDSPPRATTTTTNTNGQVRNERSRISTITRNTHRNHTVGPTSSISRPSIKPSRFSFHGFGIDGNRRVVSGSSVASHDGSISEKSSSSSTSSLPVYNNGGGGGGTRTESEKKRGELQMRVCSARMQIPGKVVLRVFRSPEECREDVEVILAGGGMVEPDDG